MVKAPSKVSAVSKKSKVSNLSLIKGSRQPSNLRSVPEKEFTEITVVIQSYQNIVPNFASSYIFSKCLYANTDHGKSARVLISDDPLTIADHQFTIKCDPENPEELNKLVVHPVILKIFQFPNTEVPLFVQEGSAKMASNDGISSIESAVSLYEALTGDVVEKETVAAAIKLPKKEKKKVKKESKGSDSQHSKKSKDSKKSKKSTSSKGSKKSNKEKKVKPVEPTEVETGACILDLLPLVFGNLTFTEFLPLLTPVPFFDERMPRSCARPGVLVTVFINKPLQFSCKPNLLNITVDSIYNSPALMSEDMEYQLCMKLPLANEPQQPIVIKNGTYKTRTETKNFKQWPDLPPSYDNVSHYSNDCDFKTVKNCVKTINLEEEIMKEKPRIQFNCIQRTVLLKDGFLALADHIRKFRRVVVEIYALKKSTQPVKAVKGKKSKVSTAEVPEEPKKEKAKTYLHLMAVVDLSSLLYPGVNKVCIAVPLTTFHEQEALEFGGLQSSYFFPSPLKEEVKEDKPPEAKSAKKPRSKGSKSSKSSKSSKKSSKDSKGKKKRKAEQPQDIDLKDKLPPAPLPVPPPEPSFKVYNDDGTPTFILLEFELTEPLVEKRKIDDLHGSLRKLVQTNSETPKIVFDHDLITELCRKKVKEIITQINQEYSCYVEKKKRCNCSNQADFLTYLRRTGLYHKLMLSMVEMASTIGQSKLNVVGLDQIKQHKLIQDIFILFSSEVRQILNKMNVVNRNLTENGKRSLDRLKFYAQEATEVGNLKLAEKYYCERLYRDPENPNYWFDYAVFQMESEEREKAFLCCHTALSKNIYHKNSLILTGILLADKRRTQEAEICLLTVLVQTPRWSEAWMVLYLFYKETDNVGGMDLALEMARKYSEDPCTHDDCYNSEDLAWQTNIFPNTLHFRVSVLLLKMRLYYWVENALTSEIRETGLVHYLLAVICYYKKKYRHALKHLERARFFHGSDYAVVSLTGHCYLALKECDKALEEYSHILESFERPEDAHLLFINCGQIIKNVQEARKLFLLACKNHPTPYTWLCCGVVYVKLNDLISAEECLSQSVLLDNSISVTWGYLALVNLKMKHVSEAEICYSVALKNNFHDEKLIEEIKREFQKVKPRKNSVFNVL